MKPIFYYSQKKPLRFSCQTSSIKLITSLIINSYLNSINTSTKSIQLISITDKELYRQLKYSLLILYTNIKSIIFEEVDYTLFIYK